MARSSTPATKLADEVWKPNATFPKRPVAYAESRKMQTMLDFGRATRRTIHFMGDHGVGKTSVVRKYCKDEGLVLVYLNLANMTPDDKVVVAPVTMPDGTIALKQLLMEDLTPGQPFLLVLDDARQAMKSVQNQFMQPALAWSFGQHEMPDLVGVCMLDNEGAAEGIRTSEDPAVADRKVTVRLVANDTGWRYALADKYASTDLNGVFGVWDSLNKDLRHILSPRALDHVIYATINGFPPILGLPIVGDQRQRLVSEDNDRTKEILEKIAAALHQPYRESIPDLVDRAIDAALRDRLAILIQGGPGIGKTARTKARIAKAGVDQVYFSMPFADPEAFVAPMPTKDGKLAALVAEVLKSPDPYAIVWDEYNRPASAASFAKLMEITQEWSIAGVPLTGCRAQIALCNPAEWQGRRMLVSKGNIAQGDRFTLSLQVSEDDIPANEWLLTSWPDTVSHGDPVARERARSVIETVIEWYKNDIGDEMRGWITKRTLERLAELHMHGLPLEIGKIYLGEGEYAPVPLVDLERRLADRPMARLKEIAADLDGWLARLAAASETSEMGSNDTDQVHQALSQAELPQLKEHFEAVWQLTRALPQKLRGTFFWGANEQQRQFWVDVMKRIVAEMAPAT